MKTGIDYQEAKRILLALTGPIETEKTDLDQSFGRIISEDIRAAFDVPSFDRSPYDGYALRACDTADADHIPVTLKVTGYAAAGDAPCRTVGHGEAVRILTGAMIPKGADAVIMQEKVSRTEESITISTRLSSGENIVKAGEDVHKGELLARKGTVIDPGLSGAMAAQGITRVQAYKRPAIGIISVGNELVTAGDEVSGAKIYDTDRSILSAAIRDTGCIPCFLGTAGDDVDQIKKLIADGLKKSDMVILTGGVSVGDLDLTPKAMSEAGCDLLISGIRIKPGMACCYGISEGKLVLGLSGNPAAAYTNFCMVLLPVIRKLSGRYPYDNVHIPVTLSDPFPKESRTTRILRGTLDLSDGTCRMKINEDQGNVVIRSIIGCDVMAEVPEGTGPLSRGTVLRGFLI